ncbi:MAG: hypothetical protein D3903_18675 [Candidatus Electrothrix sp. GM3_4]|nr:hypothetical protein [Candidatus Electrothrix sp. GM3_4]
MKGKKDTLALWLHRTGLLKLFDSVQSNQLIVINYHRIQSDNQKKITLFDDGVFGPTESELEQQFHWFKYNMDVLSEDDLLHIFNGGMVPPGRSLLITFDDGYIDNYTLAYPLLRKNNFPAIFFIPTQSINERTLGWWDYIAYMLKMSQQETIIFEGQKLFLRSETNKTIHYILNYIHCNKVDVDELLVDLSLVCDVKFPSIEIQDKELMTWENLQEVSKHGISVGSHTNSHNILSYLNKEKQAEELVLSKYLIEKKLGTKVQSMSYPVGTYSTFTAVTKRLAAECGYDMAFSFLTGINSWEKMDMMDMKRISVPNYFPRFVCTMRMPAFFNDSGVHCKHYR